MNSFRENFKGADYGPKNDPFTPFKHNMSYPFKSKTAIFTKPLMPVIR